jgi:threonine/homoserine/homoserine lactone efflux protein
MSHLLVLFFVTFSAAFMATVPPGLLNMSAAKISVEKGPNNAYIFSLGVVVVVLIQAYVAVLISKFLFSHPEVIALLMKVGRWYFLCFFSILFCVGQRPKKA